MRARGKGFAGGFPPPFEWRPPLFPEKRRETQASPARRAGLARVLDLARSRFPSGTLEVHAGVSVRSGPHGVLLLLGLLGHQGLGGQEHARDGSGVLQG